MLEKSTFQDFVKDVLVTEVKVKKPSVTPKKKQRSSYVSEAMGEGNDMPGAITKHSTDGVIGSVDMRDIGKQEDDKAKSTSTKPYPLSTVLDFIAQSGENLQNAQSMVEISLSKNNVTLSSAQKKVLKDVQQTIKSSLGNICKAAKAINSITL